MDDSPFGSKERREPLRILAYITGGFSAGCFLFYYILLGKYVPYVMAFMGLLFLVGICLRKKGGMGLALASLGILAGLVVSMSVWQTRQMPIRALDEQTISISGVVVSQPTETKYGYKVPVMFSQEGFDVRGILYYSNLELGLGDKVQGDVAVRILEYASEDSYVSMTAKKGFELVEKGDKIPISLFPAKCLQRVNETIEQLFSGETAHFVRALLTGNRSGLSYEFTNQLSITGTTHIVAISGMHISILIGFLSLLVGNRRKLTLFIGLPVIWFYCIMVGASASVVRASVMQSFLLLAPLFGRENDPATSLFTALFLILLPSPEAIRSAGLQMSFLATAGIMLCSRKIYQSIWELPFITHVTKYNALCSGIAKVMITALSTSLSVIPFLLPLMIYYFKVFSLVSIVGSMFLLPLIPFCFGGSFLAVVLGIIYMPLGALVAIPVQLIMEFVIWIIESMSKIPFASLYGNQLYMIVFMVFVYGILIFMVSGWCKVSMIWVIGSIGAVFCGCLTFSALEYGRADLSITMLDVGQGQCIYLQSDGMSCVYDCGGSKGNAGETTARFLQSINQSAVDVLVVSHYDADHAGGVVQLLSRVPVGTVCLPKTAEELSIQTEILEAAQENGCDIIFVEEDMTIDFGHGQIDVFAPVSQESSNDGSLSLYAKVGDYDALFTGDMGITAEKRLVYLHDLKDVDVVAAGHHGADNSTGTAFLHCLDPDIALISVGDNSYGHPAQETLDRFEEYDVPYYRTDLYGNITVRR